MASLMGTTASVPENKEFLGGWRNRITGLLYYNAFTQTNKCGRKGQHVTDQATQTTRFVDRSTCTNRDAKVQVEFSSDESSTIVPTRPTSATMSRVVSPEKLQPDFHRRIVESAVKIQRFYRRYREKLNENSRDTVDTTIPIAPSSDERIHGADDFAILNQRSPTTKADFELLYNLLDRWRILEAERSAREFRGSSKIALSSMILSKEVELLRAIDSLKTLSRLKKREKNYRKFLDDLSTSVTWRTRNGRSILVDTPRVLRARAYRDLFLQLENCELSRNERAIHLQRVRQIAVAYTCKNSRRLLRLIDQELDLLTINVDQTRLVCLRDRLKMSFLRLIRDILKNDDEDEGWFQESKKLCKNCGRLLPIDKFSSEDGLSSSCNYCVYLRASKEPRIVYEPYAKMLRDVRRSEVKLGCHSSSAFAIRPEVIYHLVNDVWHGRSAVSGSDNFDELRLVRFCGDIEWSPWNSLLLTAKEAKVHRMIDDPRQFYGPTLLQAFRTKNLLARVQFKSLGLP